MTAFERVARVDEIPERATRAVTKADGTAVCLIKLDGEVFAVHDNCTHQAFPMCEGAVSPDGTIECAWHGAHFDVRTGEALTPPAIDPLPVYEVRVEDGEVLVGGPRGV